MTAAQLGSLLERATNGDAESLAALRSLEPNVGGPYCLNNLCIEIHSALRYAPGRIDALVPLRSLARKVADYPSDDVLRMFNEPEWGALVAMRGPIDVVFRKRCRACSSTRYEFVGSGFAAAVAARCDACGNVVFHSAYDDRPLPACSCGGRLSTSGDRCARCGSTDEDVDELPSYEYFANHTWSFRESEGERRNG